MKKIFVLLAICLFQLGAQSQISYYLSNKFWKLKQATINGREYQMAGNSNAPTMQFSGGSIRGNGGCNAYHTKFTINGNSLVIDKIMSTRMACNALELEESEYFNAMAQSHTLSYEEGSNEFRLVNSNNDLLVFYSQFERMQSSYSPPPSERREREFHYSDNEDVRPALSKRQERRKQDLERKMRKGKLTRAERRELVRLQSKAKKGKYRKSKRGKSYHRRYNRRERGRYRKVYSHRKSKHRSGRKSKKRRR